MLHADEHKDIEGDGDMRTGSGLKIYMLLVCFFVLFYKFY